jgi:hypothetical protein
LGHKQTYAAQQVMSALHPKADIRTWPALRSAQQLRQLGDVGGDPRRASAA